MIVHNLHIECMTVYPAKTDTPLLVNADAVLPLSISTQASNRLPGGCLRSCKLVDRCRWLVRIGTNSVRYQMKALETENAELKKLAGQLSWISPV